MKFKTKIESQEDKTVKYIFDVNGQIIEYSYIDNKTNKDIICVPCQTMCNMSCKFCHLTDHIGKIKVKNLNCHDINEGVHYIIEDLKLGSRELLISYMGCGEPMDNSEEVLNSILFLQKDYSKYNIRFGLATMIPKNNWLSFFKFASVISEMKINLKIHLSLHFTDDKLRKEWMPAAWDIQSSLDALRIYHKVTGNPIEVHYTIMDDINDNEDNIAKLASLIDIGCTIKFMRFSEKESLETKATSIDIIQNHIYFLTLCGHNAEYYEPPGMDIGASCGQFLLDR